MKAFWIPQYKWQLAEWFISRNILTYAKAWRMSKKQLLGKYIEHRKQNG